MTKTYRYRLLIVGTALASVAAAAVWTIQTSWARIRSLEGRLTTGQLESFRLATDFQARLHTLDHLVLRFLAGRDAGAPAKFQEAGEALDQWIGEHDPHKNRDSNLTTDLERDVLPRLNEAYRQYLVAAGDVFGTERPAAAGSSVELERFEQRAEQVFTLGDQLAEAHRRAQDDFLAAANDELAGLRLLLMASIGVMLGLVVALGAVLYRDLVRPLRVRLVQREALLERQEKLATLGTLAAGIAHEVRNPLTSVKARLYTLGKHVKGNAPAAAAVEVIGGEIARLEHIVQDVLAFARPSDPRKVVVPADAPLREVQALMVAPLEARGVRLELEPAGSLSVAMDVPLIKQVIINLVRNAGEAIEGTGTVTLRARADRLHLDGLDGPVVVLEVADSGKGISPEVEPRLFDPFFTTKDSGTGLGLSIAARIVEKHGGLLQYQTVPGRGTTFAVILPAVPTNS